MLKKNQLFTKILALGITAILLTGFTSGPANTPGLQQPGSPSCADPNAYLELSVEPKIALAGDLVTLNIAYHHIGLQYTYILLDPSDLAVFEPPLSKPCKYDQHVNRCTAITFRTLSPGVVQFHAGATGELWDEGCHCWCMGAATDNGPATLVIAETISKIFLPSMVR